jgi:hypothetical protein
LRGLTSNYVIKGQEDQSSQKEVNKTQKVFIKPIAHNFVNDEIVPKVHTVAEATTELIITNQFSGDLEALDVKISSMMEKSNNMIPDGKQSGGTPKQKRAFICKVCGKEDNVSHIRNHIEVNHLEGISIPCDFCGKPLGSRNALGKHKRRNHTAQISC